MCDWHDSGGTGVQVKGDGERQAPGSGRYPQERMSVRGPAFGRDKRRARSICEPRRHHDENR